MWKIRFGSAIFIHVALLWSAASAQSTRICDGVTYSEDSVGNVKFASPYVGLLQLSKVYEKGVYRYEAAVYNQTLSTFYDSDSIVLHFNNGLRISKKGYLSMGDSASITKTQSKIPRCFVVFADTEFVVLSEFPLKQMEFNAHEDSVINSDEILRYAKCLWEVNLRSKGLWRKSTGPESLIVEDMPKYPGGDAALVKYLNAKASEIKGHTGVVYVSYEIKISGDVGEVKVVRGVDPETDRLAVDIVRSIEGYSPGAQGGVPVPVRFTVPIRFRN